MARINSQLLFLTTSPRSPEKMVPEIDLLIKHFEGQTWNNETQCAFMHILREEQYFNGVGEKDPAFSARDRINRAPKSLGFVSLTPTIQITPAGKALLTSKRKGDVLLRQLLKFQIPSSYHRLTPKAAKFCVKPYLEILRLVRIMGELKFDELQIFGMQLTDWHDFNNIVDKIEAFRIARAKHVGNYKTFKYNYLNNELRRIFNTRIRKGETKTRESRDKSLAYFLKTQSNNMRDYADACFRYLRATGLVSVSQIGKSLSIAPEKIKDVDYILHTIDRNPIDIEERLYIKYLGDEQTPRLLTDDYEQISHKIESEFPSVPINKNTLVKNLKDLYEDLRDKRKTDIINSQIEEIKGYRFYDDIRNIFYQILNRDLYDAPLALEWNTWRAMTMLDGGNIKANFKFDDYGQPLSTAPSNTADIVCDYGDYMICVEVTTAKGQKQYEMEGEPVARHLGKLKKNIQKPCYCLFIAPSINEACIAHFYTLHRLNITAYGGKSTIIPLSIDIFMKMLEDSYKATYVPNPEHIRKFCDFSNHIAEQCDNEITWYKQIVDKALHWLD